LVVRKVPPSNTAQLFVDLTLILHNCSSSKSLVFDNLAECCKVEKMTNAIEDVGDWRRNGEYKRRSFVRLEKSPKKTKTSKLNRSGRSLTQGFLVPFKSSEFNSSGGGQNHHLY
jgi:hypothetical protein